MFKIYCQDENNKYIYNIDFYKHNKHKNKLKIHLLGKVF